MYYSAYDRQTNRIMASGINSKSKQELYQAIADYLNSDNEEGQEQIEANENNFRAAEFEIEEHEDMYEYY